MSDHIELTEPCGLLTVSGVREYVCRLEPVGEDTVNVTVCAPTEPIVRCRDCENSSHFFQWLTPSKRANVETWVCRNMEGFEIEPDGFCAWACRKEQ